MKEKLERTILRFGLAAVILWFGIEQVTNPSNWVGYVPLWFDSIVSPEIIVYINGVFEIIASAFILINRYVKLSSILLSVHLVFIIIELGYNETAVRDIGILVGFIALIAIDRNKKLFLNN